MNHSGHYEEDLLFYFDGRPQELALYRALFLRLDSAFPAASVRVQKSQISFYDRHLFAAASLPLRRKRTWPEHCLLVTFGLPFQKLSPRIAVATEPYPNRWTHHVVLSQASQLDDELLSWLQESWAFSQSKR